MPRTVPARAYGEAPAGFGVPPEEAGFLVEVFEGLLGGRNARLTDGVREGGAGPRAAGLLGLRTGGRRGGHPAGVSRGR
ncbi:hypothetical protein ACIBL8_39590 [Streptomyces sp. NPDC050523]|uniref:hypothetical protein n=1 Tax=Streptomyces sp. NPDC050523 TaxID=3365622 RepID=UPI00379D7C43